VNSATVPSDIFPDLGDKCNVKNCTNTAAWQIEVRVPTKGGPDVYMLTNLVVCHACKPATVVGDFWSSQMQQIARMMARRSKLTLIEEKVYVSFHPYIYA
jgi:hypothetical protein